MPAPDLHARQPYGGAFREPLYQAAKHLAGTNLIEFCHAGSRHVHDRLAPAHSTGDLRDARSHNLCRIAYSFGQHVGNHRHRRRLDGYFRQRFRHHIGCRLHQRTMEGRGYRQKHCPFGAFRFCDFHRTLDRRFTAGDDHLTGAVIVSSLAYFPLRSFCRNRGRRIKF